VGILLVFLLPLLQIAQDGNFYEHYPMIRAWSGNLIRICFVMDRPEGLKCRFGRDEMVSLRSVGEFSEVVDVDFVIWYLPCFNLLLS
jgi:hypothetical protein